MPANLPERPGRPLPPRPPTTRSAHAPRSKPDPTGLRVVLGFTGVAAASALATAFLAPPATSGAAVTTTIVEPAVPVQHVTRYVQLLPGQTAPPQAAMTQAPAPTPRVVTITTRQSGTKP